MVENYFREETQEDHENLELYATKFYHISFLANGDSLNSFKTEESLI